MGPKKIRILYIEDNPADVVLLREILAEQKRVDFELTEAAQLDEGLAILASEPMDVVFLDLSLADSNGLHTFQLLKKGTQGVPVIVMTGLDDEDLAVRAVQNGAQDYLVKGSTDSNLLARSILYAIEREKLVSTLREARDQIKTLRGLIPICASCKNIRDDQGFWHQVEAFVRDHSEAEFSHGICPSCAQKLYPELYKPK